MPQRSSLLYYVIFISIGFLYPAYCSLMALETPDKLDDSAWLMYWVIFALFNIIECLLDIVFKWIPFYSLSKLCFIAWCVLPVGINGAYYIYMAFVRPFYRMYGGNISYYLTEVVEMMNSGVDYVTQVYNSV